MASAPGISGKCFENDHMKKRKSGGFQDSEESLDDFLPYAKRIKIDPEPRRKNARQMEVERKKEEERKKKEEKALLPAFTWERTTILRPGWIIDEKTKLPMFVGEKPSSSTVSLPVNPEKEVDPNLGGFRNEPCCIKCEEVSKTEGDMLKCKGPCGLNYHKHCAGVEGVDVFKCFQCVTGFHPCFICKSKDLPSDPIKNKKTTKKCSSSGCGRWYHEQCLTETVLWPQTKDGGRGITCPAHVCHTCAIADPSNPVMKYTGGLLKCIRCPTSYHNENLCQAAGTIQITLNDCVCPKHYVAPKAGTKKGGKTHINIKWCLNCSKGGDPLIFCETCPVSYHPDCIEEGIPEGKYYCDNCAAGRMPLYGEIVWAKLGSCRWWPAEVLYPEKVPDNIQLMKHQDGEFPVMFLGSHDYSWINLGRTLLYDEGYSDTFPQAGGGAKYKIALDEAADLYTKYCDVKKSLETVSEEKILKKQQISLSKPPHYVKLKKNQPYKNCPVNVVNSGEEDTCDCKPDSKDPCGETSDCWNRGISIECSPDACPARPFCKNLRFQKRDYQKVKEFNADGRGWGLKAAEDIKKGAFIMEYVGEIITMEEYTIRMEDNIDSGTRHFYYLAIDGNRMIDAGLKGNQARFMNHSCDPNADTQKWIVNGDTRVGLFANKDIPDGTELTFNYEFEALGDEKRKCLCGAGNCSGFIGEKPKPKEKPKVKKEKKVNKKAVKVQKPKIIVEQPIQPEGLRILSGTRVLGGRG